MRVRALVVTISVAACGLGFPTGAVQLQAQACGQLTCHAGSPPPPPPPPQCSDGKDNDGDASVNYPADTECESEKDDDEAN